MKLDTTVPPNHTLTASEKDFLMWLRINYKDHPDIVTETEDILRGKQRDFQHARFVQANHIRQEANNRGVSLPR